MPSSLRTSATASFSPVPWMEKKHRHTWHKLVPGAHNAIRPLRRYARKRRAEIDHRDSFTPGLESNQIERNPDLVYASPPISRKLAGLPP